MMFCPQFRKILRTKLTFLSRIAEKADKISIQAEECPVLDMRNLSKRSKKTIWRTKIVFFECFDRV